jgi:hypothetical protein
MHHNKNRWYDKKQMVADSVETLLLFPYEIQSIVAEAISFLADKEFQALEQLEHLKSLGTGKVLAFHKSKQKKRKYDANASVHKTINLLYALNEADQMFMAEKTIEMTDMVIEYLEYCKTLPTEPKAKDIKSITHSYVQNGPTETQKMIGEVKETLWKNIKERGVDVSQSIASDDDQGMRLRPNMD